MRDLLCLLLCTLYLANLITNPRATLINEFDTTYVPLNNRNSLSENDSNILILKLFNKSYPLSKLTLLQETNHFNKKGGVSDSNHTNLSFNISLMLANWERATETNYNEGVKVPNKNETIFFAITNDIDKPKSFTMGKEHDNLSQNGHEQLTISEYRYNKSTKIKPSSLFIAFLFSLLLFLPTLT